MIRYYEEFKTEQEAIAFREALYANYHPMGYGTNIKIEKSADGTKWIASGYRSHSCD